jgi:predicted regulator of Ras-like GTPase activity (Roadblock/LC7/MglB family)
MSASSPQATADAGLALARMTEMSADVRGCAILDASGALMASSSDAEVWGSAAVSLLEAADAAGERPAMQAHVATEEGEVFAVREGGLAMVAVAERFTLASLMLFDMRTVLRDLAAGKGVPDRRKPHPRDLASEAEEPEG